MFGFGPKIDVKKISDEVASGQAVLVDVRESHEWDAGHASGAIHIPLGKIAEGATPTNDTNKKVYLYCASGGRSGMATNILSQRGFKAENIGGLSAWRGAGGTVEL